MQEFHALLREWETFYLLTGTAGATLAGLMFVVLTFGERLNDRGRLPILRAHSDPALLALVLNLLLGALFLMPSLNHFWFGGLLLAAGVLSLVYISLVLYPLVRARLVRGWDFSDWLWYAGAPLLSGVMLLVSGGLGLSAQSRLALTLTGITLLVLLTMGIRNAWDLVTFNIAYQLSQEQGEQDTAATPDRP